jgi:hypothetical protein
VKVLISLYFYQNENELTRKSWIGRSIWAVIAHLCIPLVDKEYGN